MEIKFENVSYLNKLKNINFSINKSGIYSFIGTYVSNNYLIGDLLKLNLIYDGNIIINKKEINDYKNKNILNRKIGYVYNNPYEMLGKQTVYEEFLNTLKKYGYKTNQINERINESLKILNIDEEILYENIYDLSIINAKKVALTRELIYNPDIIIIDNITSGLTKSDKNDISRILKLLKNKYNKIIILITKDTDFSNEITDYIYLMYRGKIIDSGNRDIFKNVELLNKIGVETPKIISFISEYNKKGRNIYNYRNILDLIKGIYRDIF